MYAAIKYTTENNVPNTKTLTELADVLATDSKPCNILLSVDIRTPILI